jgi:hypothetical protein
MAADSSLKCANPGCECPSYCSGTGQFFRLEILSAHDTADPVFPERTSTPHRKPRLRVVDYWLCAGCAEVYTLSYDHEAHRVFGVKRRKIALESEPEFAGEFLISS